MISLRVEWRAVAITYGGANAGESGGQRSAER